MEAADDRQQAAGEAPRRSARESKKGQLLSLERPILNPKIVILFDANCSLCRSLATFMAARSPRSWQFKEQDSTKAATTSLGATVDGISYTGPDAWQIIIEQHPQFSSLSWLANKLGLINETAKTAEKIGSGLRLFCKSCRRKRL